MNKKLNSIGDISLLEKIMEDDDSYNLGNKRKRYMRNKKTMRAFLR